MESPIFLVNQQNITEENTIMPDQVEDFVLLPWLVRAGLIMIVFILYNLAPRSRIPPGPPSWPLIGHLHLLAAKPDKPYKVLSDLSQTYGNIMTFKFGRESAVVINDFDTVKEAFVEKSDVLSDRPDIILRWEELKGNSQGAYLLEGKLWRQYHKFSESILHKIGVRRVPFEDRFIGDLQLLTNALQEKKGESFDPSQLLNACVSSISWNLCSGQRLKYDEPLLQDLIKLVFTNLHDMKSAIVQSYLYVPVWMQNIFVRLVMNPTVEKFDSVARGLIQEYSHEFCTNQHDPVSDVTSAMLYMKSRQPDNHFYSDYSLTRTLYSFMLGGVDSMQSVLRWSFLYFIHYPEVQERCYQDILQHVGDSRYPSVTDCQNLIYITATVHEILRLASIAPLGVPHTCKVDTKIAGYTIPKDTHIFSNQYAIHRDPKHWTDPDDFLPERWISPEGKILSHYAFMPFSIGPRHCPGEKLAKLQLVLLTAGLLQRFQILPSLDFPTPDLEGVQCLSLAPKPYHIRAILR